MIERVVSEKAVAMRSARQANQVAVTAATGCTAKISEAASAGRRGDALPLSPSVFLSVNFSRFRKSR
jgi:hypothetical protein